MLTLLFKQGSTAAIGPRADVDGAGIATSCQTRTSTLAVVSVASSDVGSGGSSCAMVGP